MRFSYLEEPIIGVAPPTLPVNSISRWRPLIPVRAIGPTGRSRMFLRALVDPGSDDCVFPLNLATLLDVTFLPGRKHALHWRGQAFRLDFGEVELALADEAAIWRWPSTIAFTTATMRYPLLGMAQCLEFLNVTFLGDQRLLEIETNLAFPGTVR